MNFSEWIILMHVCLFVIPYLAAFAAAEYCPPPRPGTPPTPVPPSPSVPNPAPAPPATPNQGKWSKPHH